MMESKILFVICEGRSDDVTLHRALRNYVKSLNLNVKVEVTDGDFVYKKDVDENTCVAYLEDLIGDFKSRMFLYASDFYGIVHIVDTDGAFIDASIIEDNNDVSGYKFTTTRLLTPNRMETIKQFTKKWRIYQKLQELTMIDNIPYKKFYFSRNLEHALYDLPHATTKEKIALSNQYDALYQNDAQGFKESLKAIRFNIPEDYTASWEYIFSNNNSMRRGSNLWLLLEMLK